MGECGHVFMIAILVWHSLGTNVRSCRSPQYLELGKKQEIQCPFQDGFYAVAWYASDDIAKSKSIIRLVNGVKQGDGYTSDEYDIQMDGSLIINNVSLQHDHIFTVLKFESQGDSRLPFFVQVVVTVKPDVDFPVIDLCEENPFCFSQLSPGSNVTCFVRGARPAVSLKWVKRIDGEDKDVSFENYDVGNNSTFTSRSVASSIFTSSSLLSILVCKANTSNGLLLHNESTIFVENSHIDLSNVTSVTFYVEQDSMLQLSCSKSIVSLVVWKISKAKEDLFHTIGYAAFFGGNLSNLYLDDYALRSNGSLTLPKAGAKHEGLYACIYERGSASGIVVYNVIVFVAATPVVDGCTLAQYCVLSAQYEGNLTCSVAGIRPKVRLEWKALDDNDASSIMFTDHTVTNTNGETYDIKLTSNYEIQKTSKNRLTLECRIVGPRITAFSSTAKFDLLISNVQHTETKPTDVVAATKPNLPLILIVIVISVLILPLVFYTTIKVQQMAKILQMNRRKNPLIQLDDFEKGDSSGDFPTHGSDIRNSRSKNYNGLKKNGYQGLPPNELGDKEYYSDMKNEFIFELKAKYQILFNSIQPIPYVRDKLYCVDKVFIEGGIQYLVTKEMICGNGKWEELPSHHSILNDPRVKSNTRILEGEPGYGKSTLALQLAYDWCNKIKESYLKNIDILVILRLRQLKGVRSIFEAIRRLLLPIDSALTENDLRRILLESPSIVVVLDGFDEYPDQSGEANPDILNIIAKEMFLKCEVIVTTRSSCLPTNFPPLTKRIQLTGFDRTAQDKYIQKAVVGKDNVAAEKIMKQLKENPFLKDLCEVPLFFVMFAHMSHESDIFQTCRSVTGFFWHLISCLHSHMRNKMKDKNVIQFELFETDHQKLDKVAFDGLREKGKKLMWKKEELLQILGQDFYDQYVKIGILVEEQVLDIFHTVNFQASRDIKYETDVHFYHKTFCEWYAAHYLAECIADIATESDGREKEDPNNEIHHCLKCLDPFDLQYTYRFACGLNPRASECIVAFLKGQKNADKFAILCTLEQGDSDLQNVKDLCSKEISLNADDTFLLQRSTIQLLKVASINEIVVSSVLLKECYRTFDQPSGNIHLKSAFTLPVLTTTKKLCIQETRTDMSLESLSGIFQYASKCPSLEELWFNHCMLPRCMPIDSFSKSNQRDVGVKKKPLCVFWGICRNTYYLNLTTGLWQRPPQFGSSVMSDEDYKRAVDDAKQRKGAW